MSVELLPATFIKFRPIVPETKKKGGKKIEKRTDINPRSRVRLQILNWNFRKGSLLGVIRTDDFVLLLLYAARLKH